MIKSVEILGIYSDELANAIEVVKALRSRHTTPLQDATVKSLGLSRRLVESLITEIEKNGKSNSVR